MRFSGRLLGGRLLGGRLLGGRLLGGRLLGGRLLGGGLLGRAPWLRALSCCALLGRAGSPSALRLFAPGFYLSLPCALLPALLLASSLSAGGRLARFLVAAPQGSPPGEGTPQGRAGGWGARAERRSFVTRLLLRALLLRALLLRTGGGH